MKTVANLLEYVEVNPKTKPDACIIWLHGLGADGHDFEDMVPQLQLPKEFSVRFVFPHAPIRPITLNAGYQMRAWYDIFGLDENSRQDERGIKEAQQALANLIEHEKNTHNLPSNRILLGGFSQGGATALYTGLRYPQKLAGIIGLSTYLPLSAQLKQEANQINKTTPIMMAHGTDDMVVPYVFGERSYQFLREQEYQVDWYSYQMGHSVCPQEIIDMSNWLRKILPFVER